LDETAIPNMRYATAWGSESPADRDNKVCRNVHTARNLYHSTSVEHENMNHTAADRCDDI